jgi:hypothetical protein
MTQAVTRYRCASSDPVRCRYTDCPEQHPVAPDSVDDGIEDSEEEWITCPTCREELGWPPLTDEEQAAAKRGEYSKTPRLPTNEGGHMTAEYEIPNVKPGDRRIFGGPYQEHRARHGQTCVIVRVIDVADDDHDEEVLPMYAVRFEGDGVEFDAWPEEIQRAAT